jgi:hypothetical protein
MPLSDGVPTGAERQRLLDELSAVFTRCGEQAAAIEEERLTALRPIAGVGELMALRDARVIEAERTRAAAISKAQAAFELAIDEASSDFVTSVRKADADVQRSKPELERKRERIVQDAEEAFEADWRAIHAATAGLQSIADAELKARKRRDEAIARAEIAARDASDAADRAREAAHASALNAQIAAHEKADRDRDSSEAAARAAYEHAVEAADANLGDRLRSIPAAAVVMSEASRKREELDARCNEEKRAIERQLAGQG